MSGFNEAATIQAALVSWLTDSKIGWRHVPGDGLARGKHDVVLETSIADALIRLNPLIAEEPTRVNEVLPKVRAVVMSAVTDGVLAANERMVDWLRGTQTHKFAGTDDFAAVRLLDFENPRANELNVATEVTFFGLDERRYDLVLYINGLPLVVGETKTPTSISRSWLNGAKDIAELYEARTPQFFVPNMLSFATEGKELRYGAVGQAPQDWLPWSRTTDPIGQPSLALVKRSAELLLTPERILDILRNYTLFTKKQTSTGTRTEKVIGRYPQVEAVESICERVKDSKRRKGLIWHHQGSGKTYLMAFAAAKLRRDLDMDAPTLLIVLDRLDLIEQTTNEFRSAGVTHLEVAETKEELRKLLSEDQRGVILTTIFRFAEAGELNRRSNIVVMVDEAHRTQEGRLGADMREALPNAYFIGLTGTPISKRDKNTFTTFGDDGDPEGVLNAYTIDRSIADGATLPVHVEARLVDYHIDQEALDEAFDLFADEHELDEEEKAGLAKRASRVETLMKVPARVEAVCEDVVAHFRAKVQPLGLKAQVVAFDREMCVLYQEKIAALLKDGEECTVVMTTGKDDPVAWQAFERSRDEEARIKARFRDAHDPLQLLIVTAKLLTGFDAPIEGVMYLDKPLRAHTLFQAITRTNRRYTNPITEQQKRYGLVVDYVGLGTEVAKALNIKNTGAGKKLPSDVEVLYAELEAAIEELLKPFAGIARDDAGFATLMAAQERLVDGEVRDRWAAEFLHAEGLFEFLWPETELRKYEADYRWLAKIYQSVQPVVNADALLWHRLGQKTLELIATYVGGVQIDAADIEEVAVDEGTVETIQQLGFKFRSDPGGGPVTAAEVLDTIAERLKKRLEGKNVAAVYKSLAARLDALRRAKLSEASASIDFLKQILELAREVVEAERREAEGSLELEDASILPDPNIGALTQILNEFKPDLTPAIVEKVVTEIDAIVKEVRFSGWQVSQPGDKEVRRQIRKVLNANSLPATGPLFDRAYAYIAQNY
ncbi:MAG: type I restriction endonuclease subunit R [Candidatus Dormibacteria bacterium]